MTSYDLIIGVFACDTIERYRNEILKIEETYGALAHAHPRIKLLYFLGEEVVLEGPQYIHLKGVKNDYISASYKQWHGLNYIYENYKFKFVMCIGTDTYLNIPKLYKFIQQFDSSKKHYIGGHGEYRDVNGQWIFYHCGGPGVILSKSTLMSIKAQFQDVDAFMENWKVIATRTNFPYSLQPACDVALAYIIVQDIQNQYHLTKVEEFYRCNFKGIIQGTPCCAYKINVKNIISCHSMSLEDFDIFTMILEDNNYFL